jgi:hypothetical protein
MPPAGFDLLTVQPVACHYTDWATVVHKFNICKAENVWSTKREKKEISQEFEWKLHEYAFSNVH